MTGHKDQLNHKKSIKVTSNLRPRDQDSSSIVFYLVIPKTFFMWRYTFYNYNITPWHLKMMAKQNDCTILKTNFCKKSHLSTFTKNKEH